MNHFEQVIAAFIACVFLPSCADTIIINRLAPISESEPSSEVTLCRKSNFYGYATATVFHLDGKPLFRSSAAKYTKFRVQPGKHTVGLRGMGPAGPLESEKEFTAENGKAFYFHTDVDTVYQGTVADMQECFNYEFVPVQ
jgi:hypothetical protein